MPQNTKDKQLEKSQCNGVIRRFQRDCQAFELYAAETNKSDRQWVGINCEKGNEVVLYMLN